MRKAEAELQTASADLSRIERETARAQLDATLAEMRTLREKTVAAMEEASACFGEWLLLQRQLADLHNASGALPHTLALIAEADRPLDFDDVWLRSRRFLPVALEICPRVKPTTGLGR